MGNHLEQISEGRMRYTVKAGDTPGNIASRMLGDVRYADLIVTINRVYTVLDETALGVQTRFITQARIELPSNAEMQIYSRHYFNAWTATKKSWIEESATSVSSFLGKMREAAHFGAGKLNPHSNPLSFRINSKATRISCQKQLDCAPSNGTTFNGIEQYISAHISSAMNNQATDTPMQNQQRLFDAFINGAH
jgi:hypothetical protein